MLAANVVKSTRQTFTIGRAAAGLKNRLVWGCLNFDYIITCGPT